MKLFNIFKRKKNGKKETNFQINKKRIQTVKNNGKYPFFEERIIRYGYYYFDIIEYRLMKWINKKNTNYIYKENGKVIYTGSNDIFNDIHKLRNILFFNMNIGNTIKYTVIEDYSIDFHYTLIINIIY